MYIVLKNQTFELMLSLDNRSYSFSPAIQSCFSKSTKSESCFSRSKDLQIVTLADNNDVISCFICWYKHIFLVEFFEGTVHYLSG